MPAGAAVAPGRLPERLPVFFRFPQHEVRGILLALLAGDLDLPETGLKVV